MDVQHITRGSKPKSSKRRSRTGHAAEPAPEVQTAEVPAPPFEEYDPADHTVTDVLEWVANYPDRRDAVLASERAGKNRTTLVSALEGSH